ncbi:MAG: hypothetical protein WEB89_04555 [Balneolales bacterium]
MIYADHTKKLLLAATVCLGMGISYLSWLKVSPIGSILFMNYGMDHDRAGLIEQINAGLVLLAVIALFFQRSRLWAAGFLFLFTVTLVWAEVDQGGYPFSDYAFAAYAMRLATPLAFLFVFSGFLKARHPQMTDQFVQWVLIAATCMTFTIHGLEAIWAHPWFIDMTIGLADKTIGWRASQSLVEQMLLVVGIVDIGSAIALFFFRSRMAVLWMAFWGFFTCFLRIVNYGFGAAPDVLMRLPHGMVPIILYLIMQKNHNPIPISKIYSK